MNINEIKQKELKEFLVSDAMAFEFDGKYPYGIYKVETKPLQTVLIQDRKYGASNFEELGLLDAENNEFYGFDNFKARNILGISSDDPICQSAKVKCEQIGQEIEDCLKEKVNELSIEEWAAKSERSSGDFNYDLEYDYIRGGLLEEYLNVSVNIPSEEAPGTASGQRQVILDYSTDPQKYCEMRAALAIEDESKVIANGAFVSLDRKEKAIEFYSNITPAQKMRREAYQELTNNEILKDAVKITATYEADGVFHSAQIENQDLKRTLLSDSFSSYDLSPADRNAMAEKFGKLWDMSSSGVGISIVDISYRGKSVWADGGVVDGKWVRESIKPEASKSVGGFQEESILSTPKPETQRSHASLSDDLSKAKDGVSSITPNDRTRTNVKDR